MFVVKFIQFFIVWLDNKFNSIQGGIEVVDYEQAGDVKVMFKKNTVLTLTYNIIPDSKVMEDFLKGIYHDESNAWFNNRYVARVPNFY